MAIAGPPISARPQRATKSSRRISEGIARAGRPAAKKKSGKKKRGKKAAKKSAKKASKKKTTKKAPRRRKKKGAKKMAKKKTTRRRRKGQKGPNIISHKDPNGLGKGRVKCPPSKVAVATVAKHRRSGTYVFHGRCV